jgi:sugar phosphate isomerase/epimerase
MGLGGIDLTVREGGHVEPKNLSTDLPKAVDAARKAGLEMSMISTRLCDGADNDAKPILEMAGKLAIPYCRVGYHRYDFKSNPKEQLPKFADELKSLTDIAAANNVVLGYHNHSGEANVGSSVWDLDWLIEKVNSPFFGSNLDIGHAKVEGGFGSWEVNTRLIAPKAKMAAVKDFRWKGDKPEWCPLGTGIIPLNDFLTICRTAGFQGPISLHFEYKTASKEELYKEIAQAAVTLKNAMKTVGMLS